MTNQYLSDDFSVPYGKETLAGWGAKLGVSYDELVAHVDEVRNSRTIASGAKATPQRSLLYSKKIAANMLAFLNAYHDQALLTRAAESIGVTSRSISAWRREFPIFAELCGEIQDAIVDIAEDELYQRAVLGTDVNIYHQGAQIGTVKRKSDDLLKFLLNGNRAKYRAKSEVAVTGAGGGPLQVEDVNVTALREKLFEQLLAKQGEIADAKPPAPKPEGKLKKGA